MTNPAASIAPRYPSPPPYYHGTKAALKSGDLIGPGYTSNYGKRRTANNVYFAATLEAAIWGAELAVGEGPGRIYMVEPTGPWTDARISPTSGFPAIRRSPIAPSTRCGWSAK